MHLFVKTCYLSTGSLLKENRHECMRKSCRCCRKQCEGNAGSEAQMLEIGLVYRFRMFNEYVMQRVLHGILLSLRMPSKNWELITYFDCISCFLGYFPMYDEY